MFFLFVLVCCYESLFGKLADICFFASWSLDNYQLATQLATALLVQLQKNGAHGNLDIRAYIKEWIGRGSADEVEWLCSSVHSVMECHMEVQTLRRSLRMPLILAEPSFVSDLQQGGAFRAVLRFGVLSRLNCIIEDGLDSVLSVLGHEELAKRGCGTIDLFTLDTDLKARHVSTEELSLAIASRYRTIVGLEAPATWWDRSCDIALMIGSFVHGLGAYEAMRADEDLPFSYKMKQYADSDEACWSASVAFQAAATASHTVFDNALESVKTVAAREIQAAVSAAAAAAAKREQDALALRQALRQGGAAADAIYEDIMSTASMPGLAAPMEKGIKFTKNDKRLVTVPRLRSAIIEAVRSTTRVASKTDESALASVATPVSMESKDENAASVEVVSVNAVSAVEDTFPMPDSRVLDRRLMDILNVLECNDVSKIYKIADDNVCWKAKDDVLVNRRVRSNALYHIYESKHTVQRLLTEYSGVGINGYQCGSSHRSLDDGSDYGIGSACSDLAQVAYGADAHRYLRAIGVPMNLTRFAITALAYSEASTVQNMLEMEQIRFYGKQSQGPPEGNAQQQQMENKGDTVSATLDQSPTLAVDNVTVEAPKSGNSEEPSVATPSIKVEATQKEENDSKLEVSEGKLPVEPLRGALFDHVPEEFRGNAKLRAAICSAVLVYSFPSTMPGPKVVDSSLWGSLRNEFGTADDTPPVPLFSMDVFMKRVQVFADSVDLPSSEKVREYVENVLLPCCLRLCVLGNGPSVHDCRGSNGEFSTSLGVSLYPEPSKDMQSPLPDPCMELEEQSQEAVAYASAILRRVRLMRTALCIARGDVSLEKVKEATQSSFACKNLSGLPMWWCPWIHDIALLVHAATGGLFSIVKDRHENISSVFSHTAIVQSMNSIFVAKATRTLPTSVVEGSSADDPQDSIDLLAKEFPSANTLERRLAILCAVAASSLPEEVRFDHLPMFDNGGWPRL